MVTVKTEREREVRLYSLPRCPTDAPHSHKPRPRYSVDSLTHWWVGYTTKNGIKKTGTKEKLLKGKKKSIRTLQDNAEVFADPLAPLGDRHTWGQRRPPEGTTRSVATRNFLWLAFLLLLPLTDIPVRFVNCSCVIGRSGCPERLSGYFI